MGDLMCGERPTTGPPLSVVYGCVVSRLQYGCSNFHEFGTAASSVHTCCAPNPGLPAKRPPSAARLAEEANEPDEARGPLEQVLPRGG